MGKKSSSRFTVTTFVIVVAIIIFSALSDRSGDSQGRKGKQVSNMTNVTSSTKQLSTIPVKNEVLPQEDSELESFLQKEYNGFDKTPAEVMVEEIEKNIRLEASFY